MGLTQKCSRKQEVITQGVRLWQDSYYHIVTDAFFKWEKCQMPEVWQLVRVGVQPLNKTTTTEGDSFQKLLLQQQRLFPKGKVGLYLPVCRNTALFWWQQYLVHLGTQSVFFRNAYKTFSIFLYLWLHYSETAKSFNFLLPHLLFRY